MLVHRGLIWQPVDWISTAELSEIHVEIFPDEVIQDEKLAQHQSHTPDGWCPPVGANLKLAGETKKISRQTYVEQIIIRIASVKVPAKSES